jgi:hypothetical protein
MVFNATFKNISIISWWSVLLVEETGVPGENHWLAASHWLTLSHNVVSSTPRHERGSNSQLCKSNYHTITKTTAPELIELLIRNLYVPTCSGGCKKIKMFVQWNLVISNLQVWNIKPLWIFWVHRENYQPAAIHWQTLSHNVVSSTPCHERDSNSQH